MKGKIFKYGKSGDPLVRSDTGRIVILSGYELERKPSIGSTVEYKLTSKSSKVDFGRVIGEDYKSLDDLLEITLESALQAAVDETMLVLETLDKDYETLKTRGIMLKY